MAGFDMQSATQNGGGGGPGSQFGIPAALFGMTSEEFRDMPSSSLRDALDLLKDSDNKVDEVIKEIKKKAMIDAGQFEVDTEEGVYMMISDTSRYGLDRDNENMIGDLQALINALEG